jgi:hypothetical protein
MISAAGETIMSVCTAHSRLLDELERQPLGAGEEFDNGFSSLG